MGARPLDNFDFKYNRNRNGRVVFDLGYAGWLAAFER
jgi:hypothetical protein